MSKRAALYARVSTTGHNQDPELQLRELRAHCERQGWDIAGVYTDYVSSAKIRPEQQRLLADAQQSLFDVVLVWKFDRFARSAIELCQTLESLQKLGVTFASLTEQIDTATPAGKLVFTILGAVAEMERSMIRERVKAGLRNAVAKGRRLGKPPSTMDPQRVADAVRANNHSVLKASKLLGISYGLAFKLNRRALYG